MTTINNNTATVQESRNRYNELLQAALNSIKRRKTDKTAQEPEEVTTQQPEEDTTNATDVTTTATPTQQPEPVATPEEVTTPTEASKPEEVTTRKTTKTRRAKNASPKPLGRDIYHIFTDKYSKWPSLLNSGVYHDPEGYALLSDNQILIGSKLDYNSAWSGKLIKEDGAPTNYHRLSELPSLLEHRLTWGAVYTIDPDTITKKIKEVRDEAKYNKAREIFGDELSISELNEELKYNRDARREATKATKYRFVELTLPQVGKVFTSKENLERFVKTSKWLALSELRIKENKIQFEGEAGFVLACVCTEDPVYSAESLFIKIGLTDAMIPTGADAMIPTGEGATQAPEDTPAIEEETPATAPQATEEDTTTVPEATAETPVQEPEEVTTEEDATPAPADTEEEEKQKRREADNITVLKYCIEHYGEVGADYLDTLDYTQATEQVYSTKRGNTTKVTERFYSIDGRTIYGLHRRYNKNGKRAKFVVFEDGQIIEERTYGKNNNTYKAELRCAQTQGSIVRYGVEDGKVTRAEYLLTKDDKKPLSVVFDDTNRPATPRDLPAPAPTKTAKETTKEYPATTVQEQPTSKTATAPTPEATPVPEEVTTVTTSKQDDTTPYWLLLDNELRAQQQEQALATPEKSEPEEQAEEPDNEETDDTEEVVFLKGAELDKAIDEYIKKHEYLCDMLDIKYYKSHYYYYITPDGYIVKLDKKKPRRNLYIADEGPFYESYAKGEVTDRSIFFSHNLETLSDFDRDRLESTACCRVKRTKDGTLSISTYDMRPEYEYDEETKTYKEVPAKKPTPRELAVYVAAWDAYEADQRARLEKYWKRYSDKVCVNTYWADR